MVMEKCTNLRLKDFNMIPTPKLEQPPPHIVDAAETVKVWMETNGYRNWQLGGLCDRRFADECERLKTACDKWSEDETLHPLMHCKTCGRINPLMGMLTLTAMMPEISGEPLAADIRNDPNRKKTRADLERIAAQRALLETLNLWKP